MFQKEVSLVEHAEKRTMNFFFLSFLVLEKCCEVKLALSYNIFVFPISRIQLGSNRLEKYIRFTLKLELFLWFDMVLAIDSRVKISQMKNSEVN